MIKKQGFETLDIIITIVLLFLTALILIPFLNILAITLATNREYLNTRFFLFPRSPTFENYIRIIEDGRIFYGFRTTLVYVILGVPLNLFLTVTMAYGLSRLNFPGGKFIFFAILITLLFNGGIIPMYLLMMQLGLIGSIWSVILITGINTFLMIITRTYFTTIPDSLIESAKIDGAGEWKILFKVILPLSMPIIATITLFYTVDRWNEWFFSMIFIRSNFIIPLQLFIRNIAVDSNILTTINVTGDEEVRIADGMRMASVVLSMIPIFCLFPFLQRYFVKGVMIGAIKA